MNIAQRLKLDFYVSGKNYLESKGVDCSGWATKYRPVTYGWEFDVLNEKGERVLHIYCEADKQLAEFSYKDNPIAEGLAAIFKRI